MPMSPQEKAEQEAHLAQIYDWGGQVDQWGADVTTWMGQVDEYGQEAERRFVFLGSRVRDHQDQLNSHQRQLAAFGQLVHRVPLWPLAVAIAAGVVTFFIVNDNTDKTNWWCAGIGLAVAGIVFGVLSFVLTVRNTRTVARPVPQQHNQQQTPAPPAQVVTTPSAPTQPLPVVPPATPQAQQPAAATTP